MSNKKVGWILKRLLIPTDKNFTIIMKRVEDRGSPYIKPCKDLK